MSKYFVTISDQSLFKILDPAYELPAWQAV